MEKLFFCTLFDSFYLSRGLALYRSLLEQEEEFELYILAFDKLTFDILTKLNLDKVIVIPLERLETKELIKLKEKRTRGEYCWTYTPRIIDYVIKTYNLNICTYLDADIYFFNSPRILIEEIKDYKDRDVLITKHNYHKEYDQSHISGKYCVQFVTFKNNENSLKVLKWWMDSCFKWCYGRLEDGKYGDQKYLEYFEEYFKNIYVSKEIGAGLAPWNSKRFNHCNKIIESEFQEKYNVIFYHYQALKIDKKYKVLVSSLDLGDNVIEEYYLKYISEIENINQKLNYKFNYTSGLIEKINNKLKIEMIIRNIKYDVIYASKSFDGSKLMKMKFIIKRLKKISKIYKTNYFDYKGE